MPRPVPVQAARRFRSRTGGSRPALTSHASRPCDPSPRSSSLPHRTPLCRLRLRQQRPSRPLSRLPRSGYAGGPSSRPSRAAWAAAAVRDGRSSFRSRLVTWRWTVCSLMISRSAISAFVRPSATSRSTSVSRGVSPDGGEWPAHRPTAASTSRARWASVFAPSPSRRSRAAVASRSAGSVRPSEARLAASAILARRRRRRPGSRRNPRERQASRARRRARAAPAADARAAATRPPPTEHHGSPGCRPRAT